MMQQFIFKVRLLIGLMLVATAGCAGMADSRYLPFFKQPRMARGESTIFATMLHAGTARSALNARQARIGIPELFGSFDQSVLAKAIEKTGKPNPLRSDFQGFKIPWHVEGKLQMQAASFACEQKLSGDIAIGASWLFMRVHAHHIFTLDKKETNITLTPGDEQELKESRQAMLSLIGIHDGHAHQEGFGDVDAWIRLGKRYDRVLKFRTIDAGFSLGILVPTGEHRSLAHPATVPFGGNGHWGVYGALDAVFELREDMKVGLYLSGTKRCAHTKIERLPVLEEPQLFGATSGLVRINPGATIQFAPYLVLEHLRKGAGLCVQYVLTKHLKDRWKDQRSLACAPVPVNLCDVQRWSDWASDYLSVSVFYEPDRYEGPTLVPELYVRWDVPMLWCIANRVPRTNHVSFGVAWSF